MTSYNKIFLKIFDEEETPVSIPLEKQSLVPEKTEGSNRYEVGTVSYQIISPEDDPEPTVLRFDTGGAATGPHFSQKPDSSDELISERDAALRCYQSDCEKEALSETDPLIPIEQGRTEEIYTGTLPDFLSHLPKEAVRELYFLGEYLYERLVEGQKIFGFKGTKDSVGCSTLILAVAGELIKKGLSVLIVDGNRTRSDILSFLELDTKCRKRGSKGSVLDRNCELTDREFSSENTDPSLVRALLKITVPTLLNKRRTSWFSRNRSVDLSAGPFLYVLPLSFLNEGEGALTGSIQQLAREYDIVLVDSGSCQSEPFDEIVPNMLRMGEDGYFIVQDTRAREDNLIHTLATQSMEFQLPCLGIIENFV